MDSSGFVRKAGTVDIRAEQKANSGLEDGGPAAMFSDERHTLGKSVEQVFNIRYTVRHVTNHTLHIDPHSIAIYQQF